MKKLKRRLSVPVVAALCLLLVGTAAAAIAQRQLAARPAAGHPEVKVQLAGSVKRNAERFALDKIGAVNPGEILDWTVTSANEGDAPARQYKTVAQIPRGTSFVAGSASAEYNASVTYSIDGGKNYSAAPVIEEKLADGSTKSVAAPVSMYTQVRYEWSDPLAAGQTLSASYKVRVK